MNRRYISFTALLVLGSAMMYACGGAEPSAALTSVQDVNDASSSQEDASSTIDGTVALPDATGENDAAQDAETSTDAQQEAGTKGCDPFVHGDFVGSCKFANQSHCYDLYGNSSVCTSEGGHVFSAGHCPTADENMTSVGMKCYFPPSTNIGAGYCKVAYAYGDYGPTLKNWCESNGGTVIYP